MFRLNVWMTAPLSRWANNVKSMKKLMIFVDNRTEMAKIFISSFFLSKNYDNHSSNSPKFIAWMLAH